MSGLLAKNTLYLTIASVGQKLVAFVYFLFVARIMQPERTGQYFLTVSIALIFSVIADFGMTPVVIREIAKSPQETPRLLSRALSLKIPLFIIAYASAIAAALLLHYEREVVMLTMVAGLSLILDSLHLLFYGVLRGHQNLSIEATGMLTGQAVTAMVGGLSLFIHPSLLWLTFALVLGSATNVTLSSRALIARFGWSILKPHWNSANAKHLLSLALPFALAAIFVKVYSYVDSLFISKFIDTTAVGIYSIAYKFTYAFQFLPLAFTAGLYPSISAALEHHPARVPHLLRRALWYMMLISTPLVLGLWLIANQAVVLAGSAYRASGPVLSLLVFVLIPIFLDFPIGSLLNAGNRQTTKTIIMGFTMVINILLNAVLVPKIGIQGAAISALLSFSFMFISGLFFIKPVIPAFRFGPSLFDAVRFGISGLFMVMVGRLLMPIIGWMAIIPVCVAVYIIALVLTRLLVLNDVRKLKSLFSYGR
ncbi:flippase [Candidatus Uhrbacteria bacterium]|nr:flippase [Candidatus Uhrbacteria bacterium]